MDPQEQDGDNFVPWPDNEQEIKEKRKARMLATIAEKKKNFDKLVKSMFGQLKEAAKNMNDARDESDVDHCVFKVCNQLVREITLFLPAGEAINALNHSLVLLDKTKNSQLEPQDLNDMGNDFSSRVQRITQAFLSEVQLHDLRIMQRQEKFHKVCAEQERMHKHLMNRVNTDPSKESNREEYIAFLEKKDREFGLYTTGELDKMNRQRGESQAIKDRCCNFLQKLFDRKIGLLNGRNPPFDFETAVRTIRAESKERFYGAVREHASV